MMKYSQQLKNIIFDSPMPDANYVVLVNRTFTNTYWDYVETTVLNKTVNGFTIQAFNNGNGTTGEIPSFDWIAIRPNSYTREGMVEDVLFSNSSGVNSGTINLSGNISDYDFIIFNKIFCCRYGKNMRGFFVVSMN